MSEPRKAYLVPVIARSEKLVLIYADSVKDARERYYEGEGEGIDVSYEFKGLGPIRRDAGSDR